MASASTLQAQRGLATKSGPADAEPAFGRRKSDRVPLPEWLSAPLLDGEEPRDGDLLDPVEVEVGDYWFEYHEGDGTASWLRITRVECGVDGVVLTLRGSLRMPIGAGRDVWVLRRAAAAVLARETSDRVLHAWGAPESEMQAFLRECATRRELIERWKFPTPSVADALAAWELLRAADEANRTDVPPTAGAVAR